MMCNRRWLIVLLSSRSWSIALHEQLGVTLSGRIAPYKLHVSMIFVPACEASALCCTQKVAAVASVCTEKF